jgi:hypothetical protein
MRYEETITTTADRACAWAALTAVRDWPQWTKSMTSVDPVDGNGILVGNRFRVRQPGLAPMVWRVTRVDDGESFVWEARSPGVHTTAFHRVSANPDGGTQISIGIEQSGVLARPLGALLGGKFRRYLAMEAAGLKAASEA